MFAAASICCRCCYLGTAVAVLLSLFLAVCSLLCFLVEKLFSFFLMLSFSFFLSLRSRLSLSVSLPISVSFYLLSHSLSLSLSLSLLSISPVLSCFSPYLSVYFAPNLVEASKNFRNLVEANFLTCLVKEELSKLF